MPTTLRSSQKKAPKASLKPTRTKAVTRKKAPTAAGLKKRERRAKIRKDGYALRAKYHAAKEAAWAVDAADRKLVRALFDLVVGHYHVLHMLPKDRKSTGPDSDAQMKLKAAKLRKLLRMEPTHGQQTPRMDKIRAVLAVKTPVVKAASAPKTRRRPARV